MPYRFRIDAQHAMVHVEADGVVDRLESEEVIAAIPRQPEHRPHFKVLVDLRRMEYDPAPGEIETFAHSFGRLRDWYRNRIAVVAPEDLHYGLARKVGMHVEDFGITLQVFRQLDDARRWLELAAE